MSGDKTLRAIADVYERYNISDREDALVSTWGMNEADAREQIRTNSTPERAAELIKASDELKAIVQNLIDELSEQIDGTKFQNVAKTGTLIPFEYLENITKPAMSYIYPNDKTANSLQKLSIDGEEQPVKEVKDAQSYVTLNFDDAAELTDLDKKTICFSEFDQQIQEAVVSLILAGNDCISDHMIYKTLTQSGGHTTPPRWAQSIQNSMYKFSSVYITVRFDEIIKYFPELKNMNNEEYADTSGTVKTKLMMFTEIERKTKNGSKVKVYKMLEKPILYTLADLKRQVGSIPIKALENEKLKSTPENTVLKNYLLKRIDQMKKGKLSNDILFDTIYKKTNRQTEKEQRTIRDNADMMLMQFKADKIISDYEIIKSGKKAVKIVITF